MVGGRPTPHKAIIVAAGRGSRLGGLTAARPKGMVELRGVPLILWQVAALREAGVEDIAVVTGYRSESIESLGLVTVKNPLWSSTSMVHSLLCARDHIDGPVIVSYSDIVYSPDVISRLMEREEDIVVACDRGWLKLWERRFDDPLSDAESLTMGPDGRILEIGQKVSDVSRIEAQYMGLLRLSPMGLSWMDELVRVAAGDGAKPDMTALLSLLIEAGYPVFGEVVDTQWCEIDSPRDLEVASAMLDEGELKPLASLPIRTASWSSG